MHRLFHQLLSWSNANDMTVNFAKKNKNKRDDHGRVCPPAISTNLSMLQCNAEGQIGRINSFKLLGLHLDADFSWHSHVEAITSKATKRLFLKQLKRAGVPHAQLLHFYLAVIRPVSEYAAPVWHHSLNKSQTNQIKAIQKRALRIAIHVIWLIPVHCLLLELQAWATAGSYCHAIYLRTSCSRHRVYII